MSNVFHSLPQVQNHLSSLRGDQPHSGQRMRGSDGSRLFSASSSRSNTTDDLKISFKRVCIARTWGDYGRSCGRFTLGGSGNNHEFSGYIFFRLRRTGRSNR